MCTFVSGRKRIADRKRIHTDKAFVFFLHESAFGFKTAERIYPIQNNNFFAVCASRLERADHRRNIGIKTGPDILNVVHERIDMLERRTLKILTVFSVQAVYGNAGYALRAARLHGSARFFAAEQTVFGREQSADRIAFGEDFP